MEGYRGAERGCHVCSEPQRGEETDRKWDLYSATRRRSRLRRRMSPLGHFRGRGGGSGAEVGWRVKVKIPMRLLGRKLSALVLSDGKEAAKT